MPQSHAAPEVVSGSREPRAERRAWHPAGRSRRAPTRRASQLALGGVADLQELRGEDDMEDAQLRSGESIRCDLDGHETVARQQGQLARHAWEADALLILQIIFVPVPHLRCLVARDHM